MEGDLGQYAVLLTTDSRHGQWQTQARSQWLDEALAAVEGWSIAVDYYAKVVVRCCSKHFVKVHRDALQVFASTDRAVYHILHVE